MKNEEVIVLLDDKDISRKSHTLHLDSDLTLNNFRRKCSTHFKTDIVSLFKEDGLKITDTTDLKSANYVIASPYLRIRHKSIETKSKHSNLDEGSGDSTKENDCRPPHRVEIELISRPDSGKTTLIQSFIHETLQNEKSNVMKAVYHKKVDHENYTFDFFVTDAQENSDIQERELKNKDVLILLVSKEELIAAIKNNKEAETIEDINSFLGKMRKANQGGLLFLAISKCDIISYCEGQIDQMISQIKTTDVIKVSVYQDCIGMNIKNPSQMFNYIIHKYTKRFLDRQRNSYLKNSQFSELLSKNDQTKSTGMLSSIYKMFSCFSKVVS